MAQGFGKGLYKIEGLTKPIKDYITALSLNPSHRWIPIDMVLVLGHIWVTERQTQWLQTMVKVKVKKDITFTRILANTPTQ